MLIEVLVLKFVLKMMFKSGVGCEVGIDDGKQVEW